MNYTTIDDGIIIERFKQGQESAFDELVRRHQEQAYHFAYRLAKNPDEAADVVAEAFVRVYKSLGRFKGDSSFSTWLYRIETNCFLDIRKKSANRTNISLDDAPGTGMSEPALQIADMRASAHDHVERGERLTAIENALQSLSEQQRSILLMFHAEALSYEDIAVAIHRPIGTVKSRINRARMSLQQALHTSRGLFLTPKSKPRPKVFINV